jgi:hypothetical protein
MAAGMLLFLSTQPLWLSLFLLLLPATLFAMAGPAIVRRYVPFERLRTNNEVAGFKFATVGVIYAVLLAFAVIVVWERFNRAEENVAKEAGATATIYRLSRALDAPHGDAIRKATTAYLMSAIHDDWPAMGRGMDSAATTEAMGALYDAVLKFHAIDTGEGLVVAEILRQLDNVSEARRERLVAASGTVPEIIWMVLFGGAFITLAFTFFFGTANLVAQMVMSSALSLLIFGGLMTIIVIDHPFAGPVKVGAEALAAVVEDLGDH